MAEDGWYYDDRGENRGPLEMATLRRLALVGAIDAETLVWRDGMEGWEPARLHVPGVRPHRTASAPRTAAAPAGHDTGRGYSEAVGMGAAVGRFFVRYFDFAGRSNRGEYWWAVLGLALIAFIIAIVDLAAFGQGEFQPLSGLWSLATLIPYWSLGVRRLHDIDRSGWWLLAPFLLLAGGAGLIVVAAQSGSGAMLGGGVLTAGLILLLVLFVWSCQRPTPGPNRFG